MNKTPNTLFTGDNLHILHGLNSESVDLIYLDPPFNSKRTYSAPVGSRAAGASFKDMWTWDDINEAYLEIMVNDYPYLVQFIQSVEVIHGKAMMAYLTYMTQRIVEMHRVLRSTGSLYLHVDPTASHYLKVILDRIFGSKNFRNDISWCYTGPQRTKRHYPRKHDSILFYSKGPENCFNRDTIRVPSKWNETGGYSKKEVKRENKGKVPEDWWKIIFGPSSKERTGYPTQKPLALLTRIIKASSNKGDLVLDPFCGCATTCIAAQQLGRRWIGIDIEAKAAELIVTRLSDPSGPFQDFIHRTDVPQRTDIRPERPIKSARERLYASQKGLCNGCEVGFEERNLHIDHIVPKAKGGGDYYENYQLLCGHCNSVKGARPMEYLLSKIARREELMRGKITFGSKGSG